MAKSPKHAQRLLPIWNALELDTQNPRLWVVSIDTELKRHLAVSEALSQFRSDCMWVPHGKLLRLDRRSSQSLDIAISHDGIVADSARLAEEQRPGQYGDCGDACGDGNGLG